MNDNAPWHAHIYYDASERGAAERLRATFADMMVDDVAPILFIGRMTDGPVGPHPIRRVLPQPRAIRRRPQPWSVPQ